MQKNKRVVGTRFLSPITARQDYVLLGGVLLVAACCYDCNDTSENISVLLRTRHERRKNTALQLCIWRVTSSGVLSEHDIRALKTHLLSGVLII